MDKFTPDTMLNNPRASYWMKQSIRILMKGDPLQAANEAETLAQVMRQHAIAVLGGR